MPAVVVNTTAAFEGEPAIKIVGRVELLSLADVAELVRDLRAAADWAAELEMAGPDVGAGEEVQS